MAAKKSERHSVQDTSPVEWDYLGDIDPFASFSMLGQEGLVLLREMPRFTHEGEDPIPVVDPEEDLEDILEVKEPPKRIRLVPYTGEPVGTPPRHARGRTFRTTAIGARNSLSVSHHLGSDASDCAAFVGPTIPAWLYRTERNEFNPETKLRAYALMRKGSTAERISKEIKVPVPTLLQWEVMGIETGFIPPRAGRGWKRVEAEISYVGPVRTISTAAPANDPRLDFEARPRRMMRSVRA
jgi:hypothetical protein